MRSPGAVNRTHTRCTPIHAHHSKGQRLSSVRALHKAIRHSLVNQDAYAAKASLIFGQLDLKLAEFMKKAELSEEERVEKERRAALKKVEKDAQVKAKKEAEQRRKQEKLERKQAEAATKQTIDPKLEAATYVPQTVVVEESKPLKKEETKKNKKTEKKPVETPVEVKEAPIVKVEAPSPVETKPEEKVDKKTKKDKKEKKKSESEKLIDEVKLFDVTATPKNTPIDTPKEAPATPAEYDLEPQPQQQVDLSKAVHEEKKSKKNKKEKKESESKADEVNNEPVKAPVEEAVIEKVEQVKQEATPEVNGVHETESVKNLPDLVEGDEEKASFIIDEKEGEGNLGKIGKENDDFEIGVEERPAESHFKETLQNAGVAPVKHWETPNEGDVEEEQKEGLLTTLTETVTGIWDSVTAGILGGDEKDAPEAQPNRDNSEEFTSEKPLFKDEIEETITAKHLAPEEVTEKQAEQTPDIWEEFTSGKPLFKEEVNEQKQAVPEAVERKSESETTETSNKKKNKKNKGKRSTNPSESTKEVEQSEVKVSEPAAEPTSDIWEEFTSGKPLFKDELPDIAVSDAPIIVEELKQVEQNPEPIVEATPDIWEEFTSGKPLFEDKAEVEKPVSEPVQEAEPGANIWEEFTSGKPLFKEDEPEVIEEVKAVEEQTESQNKKSKNKKNKDKRSKNASESTKESEVVQAEVAPVVELKVEEKKNENKKKDRKSKKPASEVPFEQVEKGLLRTELKDSPSEMSTGSMVVNISLNEDQEKFNATQPEVEPVGSQEIQPEEETQFVAVENKKNKKKDKRPMKESERSVQEQEVSEPSNEPAVDIWEEFASGKPVFKDEVEIEKALKADEIVSEPIADQPIDIWEEFASGKPVFKDESEVEKVEEKITETSESQPSVDQPVDIWEEFTSGKPLFKDESISEQTFDETPAQPAESEAQPHEVTYGTQPLTETKKNNKKNKNKNKEKKTSESHQEPDKTESSEYELAIEKDIFQKLKPADIRKSKSKSPEPENVYVWDGLVGGVPIIKAVTSPTSSPKKVPAPVPQEAESEHKEGLLSSLAETVTGIWEDLTSGKPLFKDNEEEKVKQAESTPDIWEEFTSSKPLFKEEVNEQKQAVPEAVERKSESETTETSNKKKNKKNKGKRSTNPSESTKEVEQSEVKVSEPAAEPTSDIGEEFTSGKIGVEERPVESYFKETLQNAEVAPVKHGETPNEGDVEEEQKEGLLTTLTETVTGIWDSVTAGILGGDEKDAPEAQPTPDISEEFTSEKPLFKDEIEETITAKHLAPEEVTEKQAESTPDIWEEFTSGKPLFKEEVNEQKQAVPEAVERKSESETTETSNKKKNKKNKGKRSTNPSESTKEVEQNEVKVSEPAAEPTSDIWEEFTSGKPLFKDELPDIAVSDAPIVVEELKQVEQNPEPIVEATPDIWEEFTSGKPLFKDESVPIPTPSELESSISESFPNAPTSPPKEDPVKDKKSKKDKKNKKTSESEAKVEEIPEAVEKIEDPVQHKESSKKDKKKNKKNSESEPKVEPVETKIEVIEAPKAERLEEPVSIEIEEKESKKDKKKNKKEKKTSESQSQFSPDSGVVIEQDPSLVSPANLGNFAEMENAEVKHIDVEPEAKKVTATVTKTEDGYNAIVTEDEPQQRATNVHKAEHITLNVVYAGDGEDEEEAEPESTPAAPKQDTKESKSKKKDKKHKKSESENNVENGHPVEAAPVVEEKKEALVELKYDGPATQTADNKSKDKKDNKKKNKKGKTNSESEQVVEKKSPSPVKEVPPPVQEKPVPEPTKDEPVATPSPTNNGSSKNKKKNKGKHGKDNNSTVAVEEKQSPVSVSSVEEKQSPVPVSSGKFDPVEEASHQHVEDLKSAQPEVKVNGINGNAADDHGFEEQKGKKGRKKNKSRSSESHELNGKLENAQVITELNYNNDDVKKMGIESTSEQVATSPVQVNEVTSSEEIEGDQRVYRENIKAAYDIDSSADPTAHPTQFALQVQKLVESTLAASELKHADPNTKYSVQAQLLKLKEHDDQPKQTYTLRPLTPLAFERHVTVYTPSPRERSYKLLPKDVLFCSYMIDTYGEDYEGMTKDAKNVYRENARSLQRKMRVFKESPHFDTYKKHQETGRSVEEILQEETAAQA